MKPARRSTPPIPGLYVFPGLLPEDVQGEILGEIARAGIFRGGKRDQVMFFPSTSASISSTSTSACSSSTSTTNPPLASTNKEKTTENKNNSDSNPEFLNKTLDIVKDLLRGKVEDEVFRLLFDAHDSHNTHHHPPTETTHHQTNPDPRRQTRRQRQSILNLYPLPQSLSHSSPYNNGITPHVDLPGRYADGIVGVCLGSGVAVGFEEVDLGGDYGDFGDEEGGLWGEGGDAEEEEGDEEEVGHKLEFEDPPAPQRQKPQSPPLPAPPSKSNSNNLRKNKKMPKKKIKKKKRPTSYEVYLPRGTIYILSGEARWSWMHGIEARGEDLVWDDEGGDDDDDEIYSQDGEMEGDSDCEDFHDDRGDLKDGHGGEVYEDHIPEETLEGTSGSSLTPENPRKRKRVEHKSKRTRPRTATRILRDTRVSITYRWLKPQPRQGANRPKEAGEEYEEPDEELGGILLQDPVGEGDDWNIR